MENYYNSNYYRKTSHNDIIISALSEEVKRLRFDLKEMNQINRANLESIQILERKIKSK